MSITPMVAAVVLLMETQVVMLIPETDLRPEQLKPTLVMGQTQSFLTMFTPNMVLVASVEMVVAAVAVLVREQ